MSSSPLVALAPNVFGYEFTQRLPLGAKMPVRTTIVRLSDGSLWVHSPPEPSEALLAAIADLGPVSHIVAPSQLHHLHFAAFARHFPSATTYGAPGLAQKRSDLSFAETLGNEAPPSWLSQIEPVLLDGAPKAGEVVFCHRPSRSLIVSDLVFNVTEPRGLMTHMVLGMTGTRGKLAHSRVWSSLVTDRAAFSRSLACILSFDFDRLIVSHGKVVEEGGKHALQSVLRMEPVSFLSVSA